jgi:ankyrin repeat protein
MATTGGHTEIVKALLAKGADANVKITGALGPGIYITTTALAEAVVKGNREIVKALLDHGAEVNLKTKDDQFLLMFASKMGYREIEQMLKKAGAK